MLSWGSRGTGPDQFAAGPLGLAVRSDGLVFVGDYGYVKQSGQNGRIKVFSPSGTFEGAFGEGLFAVLGGIDIDEQGDVYAVDQSHSYSDPQRVVPFRLRPTNHPPTVDARGPYIVDEGGSATLTAIGYDPDGDTLDYSWDLNDDGNFETSGSSVVFSADELNGPIAVTVGVRATDPGGLSAVSEAEVSVRNVAPVVADSSVTTNEDVSTAIALCATDVQVDALTYSVTGGPTHGTLTGALPDLTYIPSANYCGPDSFTYKANDGAADSNVATVTITVTPVNDAPVAADDTCTTDEDTALTIAAPSVLGNDTDVESDSLTASKVTDPAHGTLALSADGSFVYTPAANYNGSDSFTYKANDGSADSNVATVTITVTPVNDAPVAENDAYTVDEDQTLTVSADLGLLANDSDVDGDAIVAELVSDPAGVLTVDADGSFTYSPVGDYYGQVTFTYRAKELAGTEYSGLATVTITVTPVNDPPIIDGITAPFDPREAGSEICVSAAFSDADPDDTHTATWSWGDGAEAAGDITEPSDGASGTVAGVHTYTVPGVYRLVLTVTDAGGLSDEAEHLFIVVYDPEGGFVTGGGWIISPAGAYVPDGSLTGKATFGFNSKYKKGAIVPTGETQFQFRVADLNFHSTDYQWLVVAGARAKYKGTGTINGAGNYGFMLTAIDGALLDGAEPDRFRIKIWDTATDAVVYDNQLGESDDSDAATAIGGGSIVVHTGAVTTSQLTAARITTAAAAPTSRGAQVVYSLSADAAVSSEVLNIAGRVVRRVCTDKEVQAGANTLLWDGNSEFGTQVPNGRYIVRIVARTADGTQSQAVVPLMIRR